MSSFAVEMDELRSILKYSDNRSIVLGDEVCKGTEHQSSIIIVSSMIKILSENQTSFITATHLHKIATLDCVKNLSRVRAKHLKISHSF